MIDFRTDLEKAIDEVADTYAKTLSVFSRNHIQSGERSILCVKYGLDFDHFDKHWCFRSAQAGETVNDIMYEHLYTPQTKSIVSYVQQMMTEIRAAVNNTDVLNTCKSYSKYLAAPLFKYKYGNTPLIINELWLNSLDIRIDVHCFDWIGEGSVSYDKYGNEHDRYHIESFHLTIPFKELTSKDRLLERIWDELSPELDSRNGFMDIDNIKISVLDMTIDISEANRGSFDHYYSDHDLLLFKRHASYKTDKEVLTTRNNLSLNGLMIENKKAIQLIRLVYIAKAGNWYSEKVNIVITDLLSNHYVDVIYLDECDVSAVKWVFRYLESEKAVHAERLVYLETFGQYPPSHSGQKEGTIKLFRELCQLRCFDQNFLSWFISIAFGDGYIE